MKSIIMGKLTVSDVVNALGLETNREHDEKIQQEKERAESVRPRKKRFIQRSRTPPPNIKHGSSQESDRTIDIDWSKMEKCPYEKFSTFSAKDLLQNFSRPVTGGGYRCFIHEVPSKYHFIELFLARCLEDLSEEDMLDHMEEHRSWLKAKEVFRDGTPVQSLSLNICGHLGPVRPLKTLTSMSSQENSRNRGLPSKKRKQTVDTAECMTPSAHKQRSGIGLKTSHGIKNSLGIKDFSKMRLKKRQTEGKTKKRKASNVPEPPIPMSTELPLSDLITEDNTPLPTDEVYHIEVVIHKALHIENSSRVLVFNDFKEDDKILDKSKFVVVERLPKKFLDSYNWVYCCSCSPDVTSVHRTSSVHQQCSYADMLSISPECLHIRTAKNLINPYDTSNDITAELAFNDADTAHVLDQEYTFPLSWDTNCIGVYDAQECSIGILSKSSTGHSVCKTCSKGCHYCNHVKAYKRLCDEADEEPLLPTNSNDGSGKSTVACSSRLSIGLTPTVRQMGIHRGGLENAVPKVMEDNSLHLILHPVGPCSSCGGEDVENTKPRMISLFSSHQIYSVRVFTMECKICGNCQEYDGCSDAVLNMGIFMVAHDKLRSYLAAFELSRTPMHSFYMTWVSDMQNAGYSNFQKLFSYNHFRSAWYSFLNLLNIDFNEGFQCSECKDCPDTIICDGTSLAFRKSLASWKPRLITVSNNPSRGSRIQDRVFLDNNKCRNLLRKYGLCTLEKPMKANEYEELVHLLHGCDESGVALSELIQSFETNLHPPQVYVPLLLTLSSRYPMCATIMPSPEIEDLVHHLINGAPVKEDPLMYMLLQREIPVLYELMSKLEGNCTPVAVRPVLSQMLYWARYPSEQGCQNSSTVTSEEDDMAFFPKLSKKRRRLHYAADKIGKEGYRCTKHYKGQHSLLPGVFTIFCKHGICYGYEVMRNHESPNVPFTIFLTRFARAPKVVIYDNACGLHLYTMNREPVFFKNTRFLVDRFHWRNHTACPKSYKLDVYPQLRKLNSQINEQVNAGLKKIKSFLAYMSQENFMAHLSLYLYLHNIKQEKKNMHT